MRPRYMFLAPVLLLCAALAAAPAYAEGHHGGHHGGGHGHSHHHGHHHDSTFVGLGFYNFYGPYPYYPYYPYAYPYYYAPPTPPVVYRQPPTIVKLSKPVAAPDENCREYQTVITVEGRSQPAYGTVCRQPDGTWRLAP